MRKVPQYRPYLHIQLLLRVPYMGLPLVFSSPLQRLLIAVDVLVMIGSDDIHVSWHYVLPLYLRLPETAATSTSTPCGNTCMSDTLCTSIKARRTVTIIMHYSIIIDSAAPDSPCKSLEGGDWSVSGYGELVMSVIMRKIHLDSPKASKGCN